MIVCWVKFMVVSFVHWDILNNMGCAEGREDDDEVEALHFQTDLKDFQSYSTRKYMILFYQSTK